MPLEAQWGKNHCTCCKASMVSNSHSSVASGHFTHHKNNSANTSSELYHHNGVLISKWDTYTIYNIPFAMIKVLLYDGVCWICSGPCGNSTRRKFEALA